MITHTIWGGVPYYKHSRLYPPNPILLIKAPFFYWLPALNPEPVESCRGASGRHARFAGAGPQWSKTTLLRLLSLNAPV